MAGMFLLALEAPNPEIHLFGDASYQHVVRTGAWAFSAPALGLPGSSIGEGPSIEYFEITAALRAVEAAIAIDRTYRPLAFTVTHS